MMCCSPKAPSIDSRTPPTTSSSMVSRIDLGKSRRSMPLTLRHRRPRPNSTCILDHEHVADPDLATFHSGSRWRAQSRIGPGWPHDPAKGWPHGVANWQPAVAILPFLDLDLQPTSRQLVAASTLDPLAQPPP